MQRSEEFIAAGAQVIVLNSFSLRKVAENIAPKHPNAKFLTCSSNTFGPNYGSYFARSYQAWYLAGFAAGRKTKTNRIGFVGSFVTPEVVRHINAFTLGAKRANAAVQVEVRWEGFWFDLDPPDPVTGEFNETKLTKQLIDTGCDVIAHNSDVGRTVEAV
ncbi:MAG: BMP family ABC transporter substrate-binding protein, partial [Myxococcales bacterium]|nr:BMP family ABC transporter substrate-binding protein [Polyangiaceae bacterium]MDW8250596.1 BMP family ABC transporter substrate-binding protein [Myxococcales bacterium]